MPTRDFRVFDIPGSLPKGCGNASRDAFTLIELLVVISIILILMALLLPVIGMVREQARRQEAGSRVAGLHQALQIYAAEERRHRFPPHAADLSLLWSPSGVTAFGEVLSILEGQGLRIDLTALDSRGIPPFRLIDPWGHPYRYLDDSDLLGVSGPQRPLAGDGISPPLAGWNAVGVRPWGYVWSVGMEAASDGTGWIYQRDSR